MAKSWTVQINERDRARKAERRARLIRAQNTRRANRRHMIEHPIRHGLGALWGR